ncbi:MAG: hypothetical protein IPK13_04040 [Deltaproteobacteria bacterium]|nr:hypothetical protein [Deltaproteobacteria bacterium]
MTFPSSVFRFEHILSTRTTSDGTFRFTFSGQDIAVRGTTADAMGLVEGADLVIVVKDPSDTLGRAGVFTKVQTFGEADFGWDTGTLMLWPAQAEVSFERASLGLVDFTWSRLKPEPSSGRNFYRVEVGGQASPQLVVRCEAGMDTTLGGCSSTGTDRLTFGISTFSLYNYYSDGGNFVGYVTGEGLQYRARAKFSVPASVPAPTGDPVSVAGIWAVGTGSDQALTDTRADDGDVTTRETIQNQATAIYVKFDNGASISDAGLLGSLVNNAYEACVSIETNTTAFDTVAEAKSASQGWSAKGKFCGGNGSDRALSALVNFRPKQVTPWLRFVIAPSDSSHAFIELGEVVAFSSTSN